MYTSTLLLSSVFNRFDLGVSDGRRPVSTRMKFSAVTCTCAHNQRHVLNKAEGKSDRWPAISVSVKKGRRFDDFTEVINKKVSRIGHRYHVRAAVSASR